MLPNPLIAGAFGQTIVLAFILLVFIVFRVSLTVFFSYSAFSSFLLVLFFVPFAGLLILYVSGKISGKDYLMRFPPETILSLGFVRASIILLFLAPFTEELVFRGLLQFSLSSLLNPLASLFLVSLVFALMHFKAVETKGLFIIFLEGIVLGLPVYFGEGLAASILSHSLMNLYGILKLNRTLS